MAFGSLLLACLGIAILLGMDAAVKELGAAIPLAEVVFLRYATSALFLLLFVAALGKAWPARANLGRHAVRALVMAATAFLFFHAVTNLPLAVATALSMTAPLYVGLFGVVLLKERLTLLVLTGLLTGLAGSLLVVFGDDGATAGLGGTEASAWIAALLAPVSYALGVVMLKSLAVNEEAGAVILAQSALGALIAAPLALPAFVAPSAVEWGLAGLAGLTGAVGYLFLVAALRRLPASVFALADYTALLWAAGLGLVFFAESPSWNLWAGGALIMIACTLALRGAAAAVSPPAGRPSSARGRRWWRGS